MQDLRVVRAVSNPHYPRDGDHIDMNTAWWMLNDMAARICVHLVECDGHPEPLSFTQKCEAVAEVHRVLHGQTLRLFDADRVRVPETRVGISAALRAQVLERDEGACLACGSADDLELDHVVPVVLGGPTTLQNLQTLCASCNRRKRVDAIDYRAHPPIVDRDPGDEHQP